MKLGLYQHYKGNLYEAVGVSRHSETLQEFVVYRALYGDYRLWIRPYEMFNEKILIDNKEVDRFKYLSPTLEVAPTIQE